MGWLKNKVRNYIGTPELSKRVTDMWWEINDKGHGFKTLHDEEHRVINYMIKMMSSPKDFEWEQNSKDIILKYKDGWIRKEHDYYKMIEFHTRDKEE